jgi:uncharacterized protein YegJ (DUF2314 family)
MTAPVFYSASPDLVHAAKQARATFKYFWRELSWERRRIVPAFSVIAVKARFEHGEAFEHMWVGDVDFDGAHVLGTLLNDPNELTTMKSGDAVKISLEDTFEDWMLASERGVFGAFSVQVLRAEMRAEDRKKHDAMWGLDFGDVGKVSLCSNADDHPMALNMVPSLEQGLAKNKQQFFAADAEGFTMLHRDALAGNACIVKTLLAHGADRNARTNRGQTPLDCARILGWPAVEALLQK